MEKVIEGIVETINYREESINDLASHSEEFRRGMSFGFALTRDNVNFLIEGRERSSDQINIDRIKNRWVHDFIKPAMDSIDFMIFMTGHVVPLNVGEIEKKNINTTVLMEDTLDEIFELLYSEGYSYEDVIDMNRQQHGKVIDFYYLKDLNKSIAVIEEKGGENNEG